MTPNFQLPIETCSAKLIDESCYEFTDYSAKGFAFQVESVEDIGKIANKIYSIAKLFCDMNIAHNVFITRGKRFENSNLGYV